MLFTRHFFFFNDTATTEIYTLSLHDALPILAFYIDRDGNLLNGGASSTLVEELNGGNDQLKAVMDRSEEHTSELQSRQYLVCRLLLEKKKQPTAPYNHTNQLSTHLPRAPQNH